MTLDLQIGSTRQGVPARRSFETWADAALDGHRDSAELSVRVVDSTEGRALNREYRGKDYATNVLSFPSDPVSGTVSDHIGDLVICADVVKKEAAEQGKPVRAHWAHLVVHGVLHLVGYDHEQPKEAEAMESAERNILAGLGFPDPYLTD